ncbi:hypothetical protein [Burkholderia cepacia]|uniref:hypothetical protein n=1 Tax=Burkholderia cepacia TaxID=292 RepID=UPI0012D9C579|nr:hypothetical protein [Burkholderia cepacia]
MWKRFSVCYSFARESDDITCELDPRDQAGSAAEAIRYRTKVVELQTGAVVRLRGLGGTITPDDCGMEIEAIAVRVKGPMVQNRKGAGHAISLSGDSVFGDPPDGAFYLTFSGDA